MFFNHKWTQQIHINSTNISSSLLFRFHHIKLDELYGSKSFWRFNYIWFSLFQYVSNYFHLLSSIVTDSQQWIVRIQFIKICYKVLQQVNLFQSQTQQLIRNMQQTTMNSFQLLISILRQTVWGNALFTVLTYSYKRNGNVDNGDKSTINITDLNVAFYSQYFTTGFNTGCFCKIQPTTCSQLSHITSRNDTVSKV